MFLPCNRGYPERWWACRKSSEVSIKSCSEDFIIAHSRLAFLVVEWKKIKQTARGQPGAELRDQKWGSRKLPGSCELRSALQGGERVICKQSWSLKKQWVLPSRYQPKIQATRFESEGEPLNKATSKWATSQDSGSSCTQQRSGKGEGRGMPWYPVSWAQNAEELKIPVVTGQILRNSSISLLNILPWTFEGGKCLQMSGAYCEQKCGHWRLSNNSWGS